MNFELVTISGLTLPIPLASSEFVMPLDEYPATITPPASMPPTAKTSFKSAG